MLDFLKRKMLSKDGTPKEALVPKASMGFFDRFKQGFDRILKGKTVLDETLVEDLEAFLMAADVGVHTTEQILNDLQHAFEKKTDVQASDLKQFVKQALYERLKPLEQPLVLAIAPKPFFMLVVGINGSGKTTSIAKIAKWYKTENKKVLLAAGDTFRAAAMEQLQHWATQQNIPLIAQHSGADSASVIFDAFAAAQARQMDVLIADTAGRLHTQDNLMEELRKICRVVRKLDPTAPHEILLVLDATLGQNALIQAKTFHEAVQFTGIVLSKLDGTAKGGLIFDIAQTLNIPIRFIGVGEKIDDLQVFEAKLFMDALFDE
jgi:fused signal recognition particle receptor